MGRVRIVKDQGDPGNFYFTEPAEQSIFSKKPFSFTKPSDKVEPVNLHSYKERSNCRTISIRNNTLARVPEKIAYLLHEHPTAQEIQDYHELQAVEGFGERAIVARKYFSVDHASSCNQWGVILLSHHTVRGSVAKWAPYTVRWSLMGEIESTWAEDLVLIHPSLDKEHLREILEVQGVTDD